MWPLAGGVFTLPKENNKRILTGLLAQYENVLDAKAMCGFKMVLILSISPSSTIAKDPS